jgi:hypothetical protein
MRLSLLGTSGTNWPIIPAPDDRWLWLWSSRNENWRTKRKYSEKTCPSVTLSTTNPTWPDLVSNPGRRGGKPATNRLSYGCSVYRTTGHYPEPLQPSHQIFVRSILICPPLHVKLPRDLFHSDIPAKISEHIAFLPACYLFAHFILICLATEAESMKCTESPERRDRMSIRQFLYVADNR